MPALTIFAGPNGSGKSSLIRQVQFEGRENLLEPDAIAKRISPECPQQGGISAGREVLSRAAEYIRSAQSFAIETTLSGNWTTSAIREAWERSFFTTMENRLADILNMTVDPAPAKSLKDGVRERAIRETVLAF